MQVRYGLLTCFCIAASDFRFPCAILSVALIFEAVLYIPNVWARTPEGKKGDEERWRWAVFLTESKASKGTAGNDSRQRPVLGVCWFMFVPVFLFSCCRVPLCVFVFVCVCVFGLEWSSDGCWLCVCVCVCVVFSFVST